MTSKIMTKAMTAKITEWRRKMIAESFLYKANGWPLEDHHDEVVEQVSRYMKLIEDLRCTDCINEDEEYELCRLLNENLADIEGYIDSIS